MSDYEAGELQPFYASEPIPEVNEKHCQKVVGRTLEDFLQTTHTVKVLFLYTINEACEACREMLEIYQTLAEKMYEDEIVSFGYYDLFYNDHDLLKDRALPFFLIYKEGQPEPIEL